MKENKQIIKALVATALAAVLILPVGCAQEVQSTPKQSETVSPSPSNTVTTAPTTEPRAWNPKTIAEAEQITGYDIYTPSYIPADFALGSSIMINRMGFGENSWKTVTRIWLWKGNRDTDVRFDLVESPKYFEIGGGQPAEVNGKPGQRALQEESADRPASLALAWEQDGMYFSLQGSLKDPLTEQELLKIAASLRHLP